MKNRRMISDDVFNDNRFIRLSKDSKLLYSYLVLNADDDGVVTSTIVATAIAGVDERCLMELHKAGFIISLDSESGIWAITHWLVMNRIDSRYYRVLAPDEYRSMLYVCDDRTYSLSQGKTGKTIDEFRFEKSKKNEALPTKEESKLHGQETSPSSSIDLSSKQKDALIDKYGENINAIMTRITDYIEAEGDVSAGTYDNIVKLAERINESLEYGVVWPSNSDLSKLIYDKTLADEIL